MALLEGANLLNAIKLNYWIYSFYKDRAKTRWFRKFYNCTVFCEYPEKFFEYYRMSIGTFNEQSVAMLFTTFVAKVRVIDLGLVK